MGYLSQNHVQGFRALESNHASLTALNQEERVLRNRIKTIDKTLSGLPDSYVTKRIRERENAGYDGLQARLTEVINEKANLEKLSINTKAYSAPIFATARIFNINETRAASMFILFLVAVLEPLSIGLAVAVSITWLPGRQEGVSLLQLDKQKEESKVGTVSQIEESKGAAVLQTEEKIVTNVTNLDPVTVSIMRLVDSNGGFSGTVSELLETLNTGSQELADKNGWPEGSPYPGQAVKIP